MGELLTLLLATGAASFVAIALVLVARGTLRRRFGPALAYCAWIAVPVVILSMTLSTRDPAQPAAPEAAGALLDSTGLALAQMVPATPDTTQLILWIWLAGALFTALALFFAQVSYVRALGALQPRDGLWYTLRTEVSPCVIGLIRPRIVVPADFESRYTLHERDMILSHERMHVRRGDLLANGLSMLIRCLLWFNPLTHLGTGYFRFDQELACDASTLHRCSGSRKCYAAALLKSAGIDRPLPLSSLWLSAQTLKERLLTLQRPPTSGRGRACGHALVVAATVLLGMGAWEIHPTQAYSATARARATVIRAGAVYPPAPTHMRSRECPQTQQEALAHKARAIKNNPAPMTTAPITRATR